MNLTIVIHLLVILTCLGFISACRYQQLRTELNKDGYISSLNYPELYPPGACQLWSLKGWPGTKMTLSIIDLDVPSSNIKEPCEQSYLLFGPSNQRKLCGSSQREHFKPYTAFLSSSVTTVFILFNTTRLGPVGQGFYISYRLSTVSDYWGGEYHNIAAISTAAPTTVSTKTSTVDKTQTSMGEVDGFEDASCYIDSEDYSMIILGISSLYRQLVRYKMCVWHLYPPVPPGYELFSTLSIYACRLNPGDILSVYEGHHLLGNYDNLTCSIVLNPERNDIRIVYKPNLDELISRGVPELSFQFSSSLRCLKGYQKCSNDEAQCYPVNKACDGIIDCPLHGGDEQGCTCPYGQYSCNTSVPSCYLESDRCNGHGECKNYMDEMNCTIEQCSPSRGLFLCGNGHCIFEKWRCDHTRDCEDSSDEDNCPAGLSPRVIVAAVVGALACSLVLVVALGCVCKVYNLRMQQLHGITGHQRLDTPLTRLQAELFRRRAPPPPYNEAMLTSRPYDEVHQERENTSRSGCDRNHLLHGEHGSNLPTRGVHNCRRYRRRHLRQHRTHDALSSSATVGLGSDLIHGENLLLLTSVEGSRSSDSHGLSALAEPGATGLGDEGAPPPYDLLHHCDSSHLIDSSSSSSGEDQDNEDEDDDEGGSGAGVEDDVPLLYLGSITSADIELSSEVNDLSASTSTANRSSVNTSQRRGVVNPALVIGEDDSDKEAETASTSLSIESDAVHSVGEGRDEGDKEGDGRSMPLIEEDSDSDCILAGNDVCEEYDDNGNEGNRNGRYIDSDAPLLTHL